MNLRWVIHIYDYNEVFLYEIIEEYKDANSIEEKNEIFNSFCSSIWASNNKRRTYMKVIRFKISKNLLDTELGQVFDTWSEIEYKYYKSMTKDENWCSIIRQKINNIYTRYFDKEVILNKEYMNLLKKPKCLYFDWVSGIEMNADEVTNIIDDAIDKAENLKHRFQMEKMTLSWNEYKKIVEGFLRRCFDNCKLINEYEDETQIMSNYDFMTEDNFYVRYINRSLDGEIRKYQKRYYGVRDHKKYKRCDDCASLFELKSANQHRCPICQSKYNRKNKTEKQRKYRVEKL